MCQGAKAAANVQPGKGIAKGGRIPWKDKASWASAGKQSIYYQEAAKRYKAAVAVQRGKTRDFWAIMEELVA